MPAVRPAHSGDVPAILSLIGGVFAEYGCLLDAEHEDTHLLNPGEHFRARSGEFWVVEDAGHTFATVAVEIAERVAELKCLYVHQDSRRQGWGRRLTQMCIDFARQAGATRMVLWSDTRFRAAHALYYAVGFRQRGTRDLHDSNSTTEFGFTLDL